MSLRTIWILVVAAAAVTGCRKDPEVPTPEPRMPVLPEVEFGYSELDYPDAWLADPAMQLFGSNQGITVTDAGATLGRVLFYDTELSSNREVSCATCHQQAHGFADPVAHSRGVSEVVTPRNSMGLANFRYQRRLFWDQRVNGLLNQVLLPIQHPDEMGLDLDSMVVRMAASSYYPALFERAFGDSVPSASRVAEALSQFLMCFHSSASRYDAGLVDGFARFSESELLGKSVFFNGETRCNQCHMNRTFLSNQAFINGLETDYAATGDAGIGDLTGQADDDGRFKTVSLRNIGLTAPYMHDGRFATLRDVVDFYSENIQPHPYLDERLSETGAGPLGQDPYRLDLTEAERVGLVDFLHTLSDTVMVDAWWLSDPF
jgi:cytochrome c peroxidase